MEIVHQIMTDAEIIIACIVCCLMVLDFLSGSVSAMIQHNWCTKVMREGLLHKCSLMLCMVLGIVLNFAQRYMDLGITIPVYQSISVYIALMEAGSVIENVCKANPNLVPEKLRLVLGVASQTEQGSGTDPENEGGNNGD